MNRALEKKLYRACLLLFGDDINVSRDFLYYIQPSGIKSAYRRRAMLTHPDRSASLGDDDRKKNSDMFIEANRAYELLISFARSRDGRARRARSHWSHGHKERTRGKHPRADRRRQGNYYGGRVPERKLPIGQFLFYSGRVSWENLIKAIIWQRRQRPKVGEIARRWGLLSDRQIVWLISRRNPGEQLGEAAVRLKLLKRHQVDALLNYQKKHQKPFGEYFREHDILREEEFEELLKAFARHNSRHRRYHRSRRAYTR